MKARAKLCIFLYRGIIEADEECEDYIKQYVAEEDLVVEMREDKKSSESVTGEIYCICIKSM